MIDHKKRVTIKAIRPYGGEATKELMDFSARLFGWGLELKELRAENVNMKGTISIKQDRVNDLESALRDTLRQLEKAINGNAMDGDWIAAELSGRECLYAT